MHSLLWFITSIVLILAGIVSWIAWAVWISKRG